MKKLFKSITDFVIDGLTGISQIGGDTTALASKRLRFERILQDKALKVEYIQKVQELNLELAKTINKNSSEYAQNTIKVDNKEVSLNDIADSIMPDSEFQELMNKYK